MHVHSVERPNLVLIEIDGCPIHPNLGPSVLAYEFANVIEVGVGRNALSAASDALDVVSGRSYERYLP